MKTIRYWISDALYWLADIINPNEPEIHINGKPISECTEDEKNIFLHMDPLPKDELPRRFFDED
jgi:hypothetical protein